MDSRPAPIKIGATRRSFFGLVHQFAAGEKTPAVTAGQVGAFDKIVAEFGGDLKFTATHRVATWSPQTADQAEIQTLINRKNIFDAPQPLHFFGKEHFPQPLPHPIEIIGGSDFSLIIDDRQTVAAAITARFLHYGYVTENDVLEPARWYDTAEDWRYTAKFTAQGPNGAAVGANQPSSLPITIDPDGDFLIYKVMMVADGDFKVQFTNSHHARRRAWFSRPVWYLLIGGTTFGADPPSGSLPFKFPDLAPEWMPARGQLMVDVQDFSAATNRIHVVVEGKKLRPAGGIQVDENLMRRAATGGPGTIPRRLMV